MSNVKWHAHHHVGNILATSTDFLLGSDFIGDLEKIVECFDVTTKPRFGDVEETQYITFGSYRDNEAEFNIRHGRLKLSW